MTIEFRNMLHKIHHGRELSAGADYRVVGRGPAPDFFSVNTFETVVYPVFAGGTANCASCHGDVDAWKYPAPRNHPTATAVAPTRAWFVACISCHDSTAARAHADVNTSRFGEESCATCHGLDKDLSVQRVHLVR